MSQWSAHSDLAQINGVDIWYECIGEPKPDIAVLISGAGRTATRWSPALIGGLVDQGLGVVRFDNRDIGLSTHVDFQAHPYTLDDMATDTIGLLDRLHIDRAHLVGMSLGGMIAQLIALEQPERVRSMALLMTTPGIGDPRLTPSDPRVIETALRPVTTPAESAQRTVDLTDLLAGERFPADHAAEQAADAADETRGTNSDNAHGRVALEAPSRIEALTGLTTPTLILNGTSDPIFRPDHAAALATALPNAAHREWTGVGHQLPDAMVPELLEALTDLFDRAT